MKYRVWTLDVLGNVDDGWEVNDRSNVGDIEVNETDGLKDVWERLVAEGFANGSFEESDPTWDDESYITFDEAATGRPVFALTKED